MISKRRNQRIWNVWLKQQMQCLKLKTFCRYIYSPIMAHILLGFVAALIATVFFGSNFVIVKEYDVGDGMLYVHTLSFYLYMIQSPF